MKSERNEHTIQHLLRYQEQHEDVEEILIVLQKRRRAVTRCDGVVYSLMILNFTVFVTLQRRQIK